MDKPILLTIPPELQTAIVSYIPRPSDLKSLCLTCSELGAVATEQLYKTVVLDLCEERRKPGFFMVNRGHRHIRSLTFVDLRDPERTASAGYAIHQALELIPRNTLKHFSTQVALEQDTLTLLLTRQKALEGMSFGIMRGDIDPEDIDATPCVSKLQRLIAPFNCGDPCRPRLVDPQMELYGEVIGASHRLKCLVICPVYGDCDGSNHDSEDDMSEDYDSMEDFSNDQTRAVFEQLFDPLTSRGATLALEELRLEGLQLAASDCSFMSVLQLERLQWLSIKRCSGPHRLFQDLTLKFGSAAPKLRGLKLQELSSVSMSNLYLFLRSFSGLEYFSICSGYFALEFDTGVLDTHLASLRHLQLSRSAPTKASGTWDLPPLELQRLAQQAPSLCELALAFPRLHMRDLADGKMEQYDVAIDAMAMLPELEILHVLTWPFARVVKESLTKNFEEDAYLQELDSLANLFVQCCVARCTEKSRRMKLRAICFGPTSPYIQSNTIPTECGTRTPYRQRVFYMVEPTEKITTARRVDPALMRYHEPLLNMISQLDGKDKGMSTGSFGGLHALPI